MTKVINLEMDKFEMKDTIGYDHPMYDKVHQLVSNEVPKEDKENEVSGVIANVFIVTRLENGGKFDTHVQTDTYEDSDSTMEDFHGEVTITWK